MVGFFKLQFFLVFPFGGFVQNVRKIANNILSSSNIRNVSRLLQLLNLCLVITSKYSDLIYPNKLVVADFLKYVVARRISRYVFLSHISHISKSNVQQWPYDHIFLPYLFLYQNPNSMWKGFVYVTMWGMVL